MESSSLNSNAVLFVGLVKNPAEFALFTGRYVRVWDSEITDWVAGKIVSSDTESVTLDIVHMDKPEQTEGAEQRRIPYARISKAKLLQIGG